MPTPLQLPPGLDPVTAGRLGLWLLGKRNHRAALRRQYHVSRVHRSNQIPLRWARLVCRWKVHEYPGWIRAFGSALGLELPTARTYLFRNDRDLPLKHAIRLLELSREYRSEWDELIVDLEAYVAERSQPKRKGKVRGGGKTE